MQYAFLIYGDEAEYADMSEPQQGALMQGHAQFLADVQQRNILRGGSPLQSVKNATTVRIRSGEALITDGPFAETKEQLAGFYILECKDLDEAITMAKKIPDAPFGAIEIRPVMILG